MKKKRMAMTIRTKLLLSYFSIVGLLIITGLIGIFYIGKLHSGSDADYENVIWIISMVMLMSVLIAAFITIKMSNHFTNKLNSIQLLARRLSEYNMTDDIVIEENDEFGKTMEALNASQFMVRDLLEQIISESGTISDMGEELSQAVRKLRQRIDRANVRFLEYDEKVKNAEEDVKHILENRALDDDTVQMLKNILEKWDEARLVLEETRSNLNSNAMYLEQIGITSDYQNQIANRHKEQVEKFRV